LEEGMDCGPDIDTAGCGDENIPWRSPFFMGSTDPREDSSVVAAVLAGETDAFPVLVGRYRDAYARYATRMLGNLEDAEDALQLAFVRAYRHLGRCRDPDRFGAWLHRIVVNECRTLAHRRDRRERRQSYPDFEFDLHVDGQPEGDALLEDEIQRAMDALEIGQREAFILKYVEDLSYEQMTQITGIGESALKMRVMRARNHLRELLEGVHHD
jgi:RNA polymerase sigma-70 factor (ECF subfamily)